jgi:hypothetical protein
MRRNGVCRLRGEREKGVGGKGFGGSGMGA